MYALARVDHTCRQCINNIDKKSYAYQWLNVNVIIPFPCSFITEYIYRNLILSNFF